MIRMGFCNVDAQYELSGKEGAIYDRVANASEILLHAMREIERLAAPKSFVFHDAYLMQFAQNPSDESRHMVRIEYPKLEAVDEIVRWQIFGNIGGKIVNVVVDGVFHTYKTDRSGSSEAFMNGKPMGYKPEYGGLTLEDIWQDSGLYKQFTDKGQFTLNTKELVK